MGGVHDYATSGKLYTNYCVLHLALTCREISRDRNLCVWFGKDVHMDFSTQLYMQRVPHDQGGKRIGRIRFGQVEISNVKTDNILPSHIQYW